MGSGSALEVGAWQDESTLFVELEAVCDLAVTDPNAYSCKDKKYTIDHYTNFLWCKEHDQASAIEDPEQVHAENLAGAAFEARISELMSKLAHISNPSEHTKLMISLRVMHFSADVTTKSIAARVLRAYASAEPEEMKELFDYVELHGDTPTSCEGVTSLMIRETPGMLRLDEEINPKFYTAALYDVHYLTVKCLSRVVIGAQLTTALKDYKNTKPGGNYAAAIATHNMAWPRAQAVCCIWAQHATG